jgi:poly-gamma-glutamate capsule biosynthesis protein CapA/YwtB (metallophosphatase superfamily)
MKSNDQVDIFFLGDTYFGEWHMNLRRRKGLENVLEKKGYMHYGMNFEALFEDADEVLMNIECAITDIKKSPLASTNKGHIYSAKEDGTIRALKTLNISTAILANNHAVDYGKAGLMDTIEALERADIKYIGGGKNDEVAQKPLIFEKVCKDKTFKTAIVSCYNLTSSSQKFGFYAEENIPGVNQLRVSKIENQVKELKKKDPDMFYILSPHWGPNYVWRTYGQHRTAQQIINAGADMIVGHSAHMMQEIEYIDEKVVMYSIGNFIMNGDGEYKKRRLPPYSFIARLNVQNIDGDLVKKMIVYPFVCDNLATDFTPRFVDEKEFSHVENILRHHDINTDDYDQNVKTGKDEYGHYFEYMV